MKALEVSLAHVNHLKIKEACDIILQFYSKTSS